MEAVPRMYMLSLELKDTADRSEFGPELKRHIKQHYMEDGEKYSDEIRQLEQLRMNAVNATRDLNGISTLKKYFGQLHNLASRFPMEEGGEAAVYFSWIDTFDEEPFTHADIRFEQACVLYNLGALHAVLGAREGRGSEEEMKVACTHFQCAAGIFAYLKHEYTSDTSPDLSLELMAIYLQTMLGQAQECLLEKSMQDNRKSSLIARISTQVTDYYQQALRGLEDINITSLLGSRRTKLWKRTLTVKMLHFASLSYLYMSNQSEDQQKFGERVAYLQAATDKHNEAMKMAKGQHETVIEALNFAKDIIIGKFQSAKKDNDFVYHEKVPDIDDLGEIKGASLVKALDFQPCDETVVGPDIFRKLVPMKAHEASSMYSEEKAKLLRKTTGDIEEKDKELEQYMASLQVDQLKLDDEPETLPQQLLEVCAAISVKKEPIKTLVTSMQGLSNVVLDVDGSISEIDAILEEDAKIENEFRKEFGQKTTTNYEVIKRDLVKCRELHAKASQSNTELRIAMETHIENIKILASPLEEIQRALPSLKTAESSVDKEAEMKMKKLLEKVDEMKNQRQGFEQQLRASLQKDDITNNIVTKQQGNLQVFFQDQLGKHSALVTYINQNLSAQDNVLRALTDAHAAYADSKKITSDTIQRREDKIQELVSSFTVYDDLIAKSHKGVDFYKKLEVTVSKLLADTKELAGAAQTKRMELKEKVSKVRGPAQRPYTAKPVVPAANVPAGPKLSDFWKPKSSPDRRRGKQADPSTVPGAQRVAGGSAGVAVTGDPGAPHTYHPASYGPGHLAGHHPTPPIGAQGPVSSGPPPTSIYQPHSSVRPRGPVPLPSQAGHAPSSQNSSAAPQRGQPHSLPPEGGIPGGQPQHPQPVPVSTPHPLPVGPSQQRPGVPPGVPLSAGQPTYPHGAVPQGFPSASQIPHHHHAQNPPISQPQPPSSVSQGMNVSQAGFQPHPGNMNVGRGHPPGSMDAGRLQQPGLGSQYHFVGGVPPPNQTMFQGPTQPPTTQPVIRQQFNHPQPPAVSQLPPTSQQMTYAQSQQLQHLPPSGQPQALGQPPVSQPGGYSLPVVSQQHSFMPPSTNQPANQVPPVSRNQPISNQQSVGPPLPQQQLPGQTLPGQQGPPHSQQPPFVQQQVSYQPHGQPPTGQAANQPINQHPASQAQPMVSQSQTFNTQRPYSPQQVAGVANQPPSSLAQSSISHPQVYNQYTSQGYQPSAAAGGVVQPSSIASSQAGQVSQSPQHRVHPPASTAPRVGHGYGGAAPHGQYTGQQVPSSQHQQLPNASFAQPMGQRFGSPVHQRQPTGYHPPSGPVGPYQQYQVRPQGPPAPGQTRPPLQRPQGYGAPNQLPQQHTPAQQQLPRQQLPHQQQTPAPYAYPQQQGPRYGGPSEYTGQLQSQSPGQSQGQRPGQPHVSLVSNQALPPQSANPVKNVNMRLKAEQQSLPMPTIQPTKLTKDLLSSSPEDKGQSEVMVPQNVKKGPTKDGKLEAQPQSSGSHHQPQHGSSSFQGMRVPSQSDAQVPSQSGAQVRSQRAAQVQASPIVPGTSAPSQVGPGSSNLAILSQPVQTSGDLGTRTTNASAPPNSNLAILSQPVVSVATTPGSLGNVSSSRVTGSEDREDPYLDKATLDRFVDEVERLEKYVEGLNRQMLSGPTVLDGVWKEVNDDQEKEARSFSISVARCYPTKNRHPDIMPYDHNRVMLKSSSDDFINGSYIRDLSPSTPTFIATQAPLPATMEAFWQMIYEQQAFLLVMLVSSKSKGTSEFHQYWPTERGQSQRHGAFAVSLQSFKKSEFHVERFLQLTHVPTKQVRTVLHMQFTAWPDFGVPSQASDLLQFVSQINNYHLQQKQLTRPIVVHCSGGVDRTGTFCTVFSAVQDINSGKGITDIPNVVKNLRRQRKWMVSEKEQLKFCYEAVLCYCQQVLAKRGIFSNMSGMMSPIPSKNAPSRLNSFDVIMGADSVQSLQHSISKLSVRPPAGVQENAGEESEVQGGTPDVTSSQPSSEDGVFDNSSPVPESLVEEDTPPNIQCKESVTPVNLPAHPQTDPSCSTTNPTPTNPGSVSEMLETNLDRFSLNAQGSLPPDVVESSTIPQPARGSTGGSEGVLPSILEDLTPQNFNIREGDEKPGKGKRVSKEDFEKRKNTLGVSAVAQGGETGNDPFSSLDPLWSMKGGGQSTN